MNNIKDEILNNINKVKSKTKRTLLIYLLLVVVNILGIVVGVMNNYMMLVVITSMGVGMCMCREVYLCLDLFKMIGLERGLKNRED